MTRGEEYAKEATSRVKMIIEDAYITSLREDELLIDALIPLMDELFKLGIEYGQKGLTNEG